MIPKRTNSPFFQAVERGCLYEASKLDDVECVYIGPADNTNGTEIQVEILTEILPEIDGFAIAVKNADVIGALIDNAVMNQSKFAVTFDSDAEESLRQAYVGTDNYKFGRELSHVLLQLAPDGGKYAILSATNSEGFTSPNIFKRVQGVRDGLRRSKWIEVENSPGDCEGNSTLGILEMERLVRLHPDLNAIVPVGGWPMFGEDGWRAFVDGHPTIVTVCADTLDEQIQLMHEGAVNGLVGQLPFEMGTFAIEKLYQLKMAQDQGLPPPFENGTEFATPVLNVLQIPQDLPPLQENMNYLGSLTILGYVFLGSIVVCCIVFAAWVFWNRKSFVVRASQPPFLYMVLVGVVIMGATIIPLSIDDENVSTRGCSIACMCVPWLISVGFVTTFSALFSKLWRINKIHQSAQQFRRVKVTTKDVLAPFVVLMTFNIIVLLCWTLIAPLEYERRPSPGTDNWNRVSRSYYGACYGADDVKGGAIPYVVSLTVINFSVIVIANIQAYRARKIQMEYAESKYIALIMMSMLQGWLMGLPILALVRDDPRASYVVFTLIIFATCMATLLFLFIPKMTKKANHDSTSNRRGTDATRSRTSFSVQERPPLSTVAAIRAAAALKESQAIPTPEVIREEDERQSQVSKSAEASEVVLSEKGAITNGEARSEIVSKSTTNESKDNSGVTSESTTQHSSEAS